jgi:thioredoxin-dependent peroxiredoxin
MKEKAMRRFLMISTLLLATPATAALKPGATAPAFESQAALAGKAYAYSMKSALKKGPVVLYFFPASFTPGCTLEAHEFADTIDDFKKSGATVVGSAGDDIETLAKFSVAECRNKFPVAVATADIIKAFDVAIPLAGRTDRISYVIAPTGKIIFALTDDDYRSHVVGTLKAVRDWKAAQSKPMRKKT